MKNCIFAEYDLLKPTISIQIFIYINFRINLIQFYINFSRQEHQIELSWVQNKSVFRFLLISPFHFSFTVPLNENFFKHFA